MWKRVLLAAGTDAFGERLSDAITQQGLSVKEFAQRHEISESTLYKITSGKRTNFGVETLRDIIEALQMEEGYYEDPVIGLISTREACDQAPARIEMGGTSYRIKRLPSNSIEEEIIRGVNAEKDGIIGIVCGPIAATTLEQVLDIPVAGLQFDAELMEGSLERFIEKVGSTG
jgi:predicted transcriptional regulator